MYFYYLIALTYSCRNVIELAIKCTDKTWQADQPWLAVEGNTKVFHTVCPNYRCACHGNNTLCEVSPTKCYNLAFVGVECNVPHLTIVGTDVSHFWRPQHEVDSNAKLSAYKNNH